MRMIDAGVQANVQSYSTVVAAFSKSGDVAGAERWLEKMHAAGIKGDTISFTTVINACAQVGDVKKAETWLVRMLESGIEPNTITFNAVITACAKAGDGSRACTWLEKMKLSEVLPNSFSYNSAAKPYVARGEYRHVEELMASLREDGLPYDDFCLTSLLYAYSNAKPKQRSKVEAVFREFVTEGVHMTRTSLQALSRAIGRSEAEALCDRCGIDWQTVEADTGAGSGSGKGGRGKGRASRTQEDRGQQK